MIFFRTQAKPNRPITQSLKYNSASSCNLLPNLIIRLSCPIQHIRHNSFKDILRLERSFCLCSSDMEMFSRFTIELANLLFILHCD